MSSWPVIVALGAASIAAFTDQRARIIPNWLTFPLCALAPLAHGLWGGASALTESLLGGVVCMLPCYLLFRRGALGGGDVKLFAAFGALLGARDGLELELAAFVLVTAYAFAWTAWHGRFLALITASARATLHLLAPQRFERPRHELASTELPMGLGILCAVVALALRGLA